GEDPDDVSAAANLLVQPLLRIVRADLAPDLVREPETPAGRLWRRQDVLPRRGTAWRSCPRRGRTVRTLRRRRGGRRGCERAWLGGNQAELFHLGEDVDDSPDLDDSAVDEAADEDLVVGYGLAGWRQAHVFTLVSASNGLPGDDLVPLFDHILDRDL